MAAKGESEKSAKQGGYEPGYVFRTLRSTAYLAVFVMLTLAAYGQSKLVAPFGVGVALASVLLWGLNLFVRTIFVPPAVVSEKAEEKKKQDKKRAALLAFALIKYPLVGWLIWAIVRAWGQDMARIMAFVAGFILLQVVIALRAMGKALTTPKP